MLLTDEESLSHPTSVYGYTKKVQEELSILVAKSINIPVVAIGGITLSNAHELNDTGIAGLSVVSAIMSSENPKKSSEELLKIFNS